MQTIAPFVSPVGSDPFNPALIKNNDDILRAFALNHKASHFPYVFSAPLLTDFTFTATTGGSLVAGATHYLRVSYIGKNGETRASTEKSVVLGGGQNAINVVCPQVDTEYIQKARIYLAASGAGTGTTCYRVAEVTLSGSGTTAFLVTNYAADASNPHLSANTLASGDPLIPLIPEAFSQSESSDGLTVTMTGTTHKRVYTYGSDGILTAIAIQQLNGTTIARFSVALDASSGAFANITQLEI